MIEIGSTLGDGIVVIRHRGAVTNSEFIALAASVAEAEPHGIVLLLDWLGIEHWAFAVPEGDAVNAWRKAAKTVRRAAIIHDHRLNRQAAWLGAVLREEGVTVRSWRPEHAAAAADWLRACPQPTHRR